MQLGCEWFGDSVNTPAYPIGVCLADYRDYKSDDGLYIFSIQYQCDESNPNTLLKYEWNNTHCTGLPIKITKRNKTKGYYFNCDGLGICPYVRIKEYPMYNTSTFKQCSFHQEMWKEQAFITKTCMNFTEDFGYEYGYYVDCTASKVSIKHYNTSDCNINSHFDTTIIKQGCDESINYNTIRNYVSIDECEDQIITIPTYNPTDFPSQDPTNSPVKDITYFPSTNPTYLSFTNSTTVDTKDTNNGEHDYLLIISIVVLVFIVLIALVIGVIIGVCFTRKRQANEINLVNGMNDRLNTTKISFEQLESEGTEAENNDDQETR